MRISHVILLAFIVAMAIVGRAEASGALAVGQPSNIAKNSVAVGMSGDYTTRGSAQSAALVQCQRSHVSASTRSLCRIVSTFKDQCVAVALDPSRGKPGFGWALASNKYAAERSAIAKCQATAGPGRGWACQAASSCDGRAN